jgi:hypothetical protein
MFKQAVVPLLLLIGSVAAKCPVGAIQGLQDSDCYVIFPDWASWYNAETKCKTSGGNLASIGNAFVNTFLTQQIGPLLDSDSFWSGGQSNDGKWLWADGTPLRYKNWNKGQPSNQNGCLAVSLQSGKWSSDMCTVVKPYICQVPSFADAPSCSTSPPRKSTEPPVFSTFPTLEPYPRCAFGYTYIGSLGKCVLVSGGYATIGNNANHPCGANSTMVSIHSAVQNRDVTDFAVAQGYVNNNLWIGLHAPNGRWKWTDNSTYNYANWQPNGQNGGCAQVGWDCWVALSAYNNTQYGKSYGQWVGFNSATLHVICTIQPNY